MTNEEIIAKLESLKRMIADGQLDIDDVITDEFMKQYREIQKK